MASGIHSKIYDDFNFINKMEFFSRNPEIDATLRKLTLTHLAPAFIFLLFGYFISFLALIGEILLHRKNLRHSKVLKTRKRNKVHDENSM